MTIDTIEKWEKELKDNFYQFITCGQENNLRAFISSLLAETRKEEQLKIITQISREDCCALCGRKIGHAHSCPILLKQYPNGQMPNVYGGIDGKPISSLSSEQEEK